MNEINRSFHNQSMKGNGRACGVVVSDKPRHDDGPKNGKTSWPSVILRYPAGWISPKCREHGS